MSKVLVTDTYLTNIADAIREKINTSNSYKPAEMSDAIKSITTGSIDDNVIEFEQINSTVAAYLEAADSAYTDDNYQSISIASNYVDTTQTTWERPNGYTITVSAGSIYIIDETSGKGYIEEISAESYIVYNLIPDHIYRYWVKNSNGITSENGRLCGIGSLRMIYAPSSIHNFRDIGGWSCDGGTVNYGLIYRGAQLNYYSSGSDAVYSLISDTGINWLRNNCGIRCEIDIRTEEQTTSMTESVLGSDVSYNKYAMSDSSYIAIVSLDGSEINDTIEVIKLTMQNVIKGIPVYIHCQAGADRTGCIMYLLEGILGMSQADCDKDYELTTFYYNGSYYRHRNDTSGWVPIVQYINNLGGSTLQDNMVLWCRDAGIDSATINAFRKAMINGTPTEINYTNTIQLNLTGCTSSNIETSVVNGEGYYTTLIVDDELVMENVTITMGGTDITSDCWDASNGIIFIDKVTGNIVITAIASANYTTITFNLTNCVSSNTSISTLIGSSYETTISANTGAQLDSVVCTMNGISINVPDGAINIDSVTGEIVITAIANLINMLTVAIDSDGNLYNDGQGWKSGYRLNSSGAETTASAAYVTGFMPVCEGAHIQFENMEVPALTSVTNYALAYIAIYDDNFNSILPVYTKYIYDLQKYNNTVVDDTGNYIVSFDLNRLLATGDCADAKYLRVSCLSMNDESAIYITS